MPASSSGAALTYCWRRPPARACQYRVPTKLAWVWTDEDDEVLRSVVDLEERADELTEAETLGEDDKVVRLGWSDLAKDFAEIRESVGHGGCRYSPLERDSHARGGGGGVGWSGRRTAWTRERVLTRCVHRVASPR